MFMSESCTGKPVVCVNLYVGGWPSVDVNLIVACILSSISLGCEHVWFLVVCNQLILEGIGSQELPCSKDQNLPHVSLQF